MLVATPGQTYVTLHNSNAGSGGGGGSGVSNSTNATITNKKTTATATALSSGTPKTQNNNNHTTSSSGINKNSLNSNTHATTYNYQQISSKSDNNDCTTTKHSNNNINNSNKTTTATSSRNKITSTIMPATTKTIHSLKNEKSTTITTTSSNKQSFIQTLKDSVQKALISTTVNNSIINNKTKNGNNNCNNVTTTSIQNVTSSSTITTSSTHNTNKVSTTTTSSTTSSNSTSAAATQSSSSSSLPSVRSKYFSCSLSKLHTVAPTIIHRYPEERQHTSSTDSLQKEMCHFKPIRVAPTTPWKSGSKSRGNSLRFPKANLATKKIEFILKSNCDVNNKKRKQQQIRTHADKIGEEDDDKNEQENKEFYGIYKPKPSLTCLSTSFNTPNHQSAFVCLVAQMKSLVNIQSKKLINPAKSFRTVNLASNMEETKKKPTRSVQTITAATSTTISNSTPIDKTIKELFVRRKEKPAKKLVQAKKTQAAKEVPKVRSTRLASNAVKNKNFSTTTTTIENKSNENIKRTNTKTNEISKLSKVSITKAKSRRNIGRAKSRMVNIVALANSSTNAKEKLLKSKSDTVAAAINIEPKKTRKRKLIAEIDTEAIATSPSPLPPATTSAVKSLLKARKSSRISHFKQQTAVSQKQSTIVPLKKLRKISTTSITCFSPPLTRSRLKNLEAQGKTIITATTDTKKRKI